MLTFRVDVSEQPGPWRWSDGHVVREESRIQPFSNPVLECLAFQDHGNRFCVVVRERRAGSPGTTGRPGPHGSLVETIDEPHLQAFRDQSLQWPGEFLLLWVSPDVLRLHAGAGGVAPAYVTSSGSVLEGAWDVLALRHRLSLNRLLDRSVARALTRRWRYTSDTLWSDVFRLTERASLSFDRGRGLLLSYPEDARHVLQSRRLRPGVDPVDALDGLLDGIVDELVLPAGQVGVELSGGVDSANVAFTLTRHHVTPLGSYGVLLGGAVGRQQRRRRRALTEGLGLGDHTITSGFHLPMDPSGPRRLPHDPTGQIYLEAFEALRSRAASAGVRVLFTGFGGDETMSRRPDERAAEHVVLRPGSGEMPWLGVRSIDALPEIDTNLAPVSPAPVPSLMAHTVRGQAIMRHGMWPVSPLCDPRVKRFGDSLPVHWRRGKRLLRDRLRRAGLPEDVAVPQIAEDFDGLMQAGLRRHGLPRLRQMLRESLLVDLGYIDRAALAAACERFSAAAADGREIPDLLHDTLALEAGLRSLA